MDLFNNPFPNNAYNNAELQELQAKLELLRQQQNQANLNPNQRLNGAFGKLQDFVNSTDKNKVNYANNEENVIRKYNEMTDVFVLFLLENSRPQFEQWCRTRNINVVDEYVDTFIKKANEYVEPSIKQNNEIEFLKQQIEMLKQQIANGGAK